MVKHKTLAAALTEFARTLATDSSTQSILDQLVQRVADLLPATASGATLSAADATPEYVSGSDEFALGLEQLQTRIRQGPGRLALESGDPVVVPDVTADDRFPEFGSAAAAVGLMGVFSFPLRAGDDRLGSLDLYLRAPGGLDQADLDAAQTVADVAGAYLVNAQARDAALVESEHYRHSSLHDALTGLPNRLLLRQRLEHAALRAKRSHTNSAILFADLDRFKQVNDTYGHWVGDELLLAVANRLSRLVRPGDTLARFSGDEFVFLCEDLFSVADAETLAERIDHAFAHPFSLGDIEVSITASVGTAYAGPGQDLSAQLLVDADIAMYQAKRKGGGQHQIFDLRAAQKMTDGHRLSKDLRTALTGGELEVAYQPIVRTGDGLVTGVEALLRWTHPQRGAVPPPDMIAVAEQTGLISDIGAWVLERGCRDRAAWRQQGHEGRLDLAVNVSGRQLVSADFVATVGAVLERTSTDPAAVVLEVTEDALIEDGERAAEVLAELRRLGVRLALDDFGTGYSSLSTLRGMPFDIVKVDRALVADIDPPPGIGAVLAAVTDLAHAVGLTVTAEGVETRRQRDAIDAIGCESAQGFFYAPAMAAPAFGEQLQSGPLGQLRLPVQRTADALAR